MAPRRTQAHGTFTQVLISASECPVVIDQRQHLCQNRGLFLKM